MLKKAGIVVAAAAATLLALSPLAYAGGSPEAQNRSEQSAAGQEEPPGGLIDLDDVEVLSNLNVCPDVNAVVPIGNVLGILGLGAASANVGDAPISCTVTDNHG